MKSKYIFSVVVGFVIFVHAHYISSWINYYEAPMLNRTQFNEHLDPCPSEVYDDPMPVFTGEVTIDSTITFIDDSTLKGKGLSTSDQVLRME